MRPDVKTTTDPLDLTNMPPTDGMLLDYRTQPETDAAHRAWAVYRVVGTAVLALSLVLLFRLAAASLRSSESLVYSVAMLFWFLAYPCFGLLVLIYYLYSKRGRRAVVLLAFPAVLWGLAHLVTVGYHPLTTFLVLFIPATLFALWLSDCVFVHYATWMAANPLLGQAARERAYALIHARIPHGFDAWVNMIRQLAASLPPRQQQAEAATYPLSALFFLVALVISLFVFLLCSASYAAQLFAGMLAILTIPAVLLAGRILWRYYAQLDRIPVRLICWLSWQALASWITYNAHRTPAPGVFQSPAGSFTTRIRLWRASVFLLALSILPVSAYFPLVPFFSGPAPWLAYIEPPPVDYTFPSQDLDDIARTLEGLDGVYYHETLKTDAERYAYLQEIARERAHVAELVQREKVRQATYAVLAETPEAWIWIALKRTFTLDYLFSAAFFLSLVMSLAAAPLAFFAIFAFLCGRLLVFHYFALEAPGARHQYRDRSVWDARVERLRTSPFAVSSMDTTVRESEHLWLGTSTVNDYPVLLDRGILGEHAHILGSTGSGKTAIGLSPLIAQLIRHRDASVVVIDLKGDPALFAGTREEARAAGLPFKWFTPELGRSTYVFNPLLRAHRRRLTLHQRTELLMSAFGLLYGRFYGRDYYSDTQAHLLFKALQREPTCPSFKRLLELFRDRSIYKDMDKKQLEDSKHIWTIVERLASFAALNACAEGGMPQRVLDDAIDMAAYRESPAVVYFFLPAALENVAVVEIARLALYDLLTAATINLNVGPQVYLFIDEFQEVVSSNLQMVLRHARSRKIGLILANQTLPDLKPPGAPDLIPIIASNTRFKQIFSVNDVFQQDFLSKSSGEAMYELASKFWSWHNAGDQVREEIGPRHRVNDIIDFSNHPQRSLVHINRSSGFSQFGGYSFVMVSKFHITENEYRRREYEPWPSSNDETVVQIAEPPASPPPGPEEGRDRRTVAEDTYENMTYDKIDDLFHQTEQQEGREQQPPPEPPKQRPEPGKKKKKRKKGESPDDPSP